MSDLRTRAEITDDGELLPPELDVVGEPSQAIVDAIEAAIEAHPNAITAPRLYGPDEDLTKERAHATLTATYNELPVVEKHEPAGWLPPYRAREQIDGVLYDELPEDICFEIERKGVHGFYGEVRS